jgi:type IV secretion system protein VirD4
VQESSEYKGRRNFGEINALLATGTDLQHILTDIVNAEKDLSKFTVDSFNKYIALPEKTAQSALLDLQRATSIFQNEQILASTMVSDIDIRALQRKPMSIYLAPNVADMTLLMPLLRLIIQQTLDQLVLNHDAKARPVLFLLDEFRQLGKMNEIVSKLPFVAGYNIKMSFIIQDLKSLDEIYGESTRQSMLANCGYQLVLGANDQATADYVSKALGKTTVHYETTSRQIQFMGVHKRSTMQQVRDRDLRMPQEIRQMPESDMIILVEGRKSILGQKIRAFQQKPWKAIIAQSERTVDYPSAAEFPTINTPPVMTETYHKRHSTKEILNKTDEMIKAAATPLTSQAFETVPRTVNTNVQLPLLPSTKELISSAKNLTDLGDVHNSMEVMTWEQLGQTADLTAGTDEFLKRFVTKEKTSAEIAT